MTALDPGVVGLVGPATVETRAAASTATLAARRRGAWALYERLPQPSARHDEDWRRTDVGGLEATRFAAEPDDPGDDDHVLARLRELRGRIAPDAAFLATTRGGVRACEDTDRLTAQGVIVGNLEEISRLHPDTVERALATVATVDDTDEHGGARFLALWHALWHGGVVVHVPAGIDAVVPVVAAYGTGGDRAAIFPATLVVLEAHSSLTLIEVHASAPDGGELLSTAVSALVVGEGAQLDHCVLQRWGTGAWHIGLHRATLARDARLRSFTATLGARLQKSYIEAALVGPGAEASIAGLAFGDGTQHLDHQSLQRHAAPRTTSDLLLKVAVRDRARSVYGGLVVVEEQAQQTNAYVQNRNLMLSRGARATGIPRLEILANDVRCSHGVTAGHIDDDQRFYLRSRGIPAEDADRIIVRGFMQDALDRCPHPGFAQTVGELLDEATGVEPGVVGAPHGADDAALDADADAGGVTAEATA